MTKRMFAPVGFVLALALVACSSNDGAEAEPPLELSAGQSGAMASCLAFDPEVLADMPIAFEGTASDVDGDRVTLEVDQWFKGGDASEVALVAQQGLEALIAGISFEVGEQYLISASNGEVNYCGYSGEASPELRAGFDTAFGS